MLLLGTAFCIILTDNRGGITGMYEICVGK